MVHSLKKPRISIIIPTYNEEKNIRRTLLKLNNQTLPREDYEIIVVDGNSIDKTCEIAEQMGARIIKQKRKGIAGARTDGFLLANTEFIATTDADCIVPNRWLENFLEDFQDPRVVAVTGPTGPIEKTWKSRFFYFFIRCFNQILVFFNLQGPAGTNCAFRKSAFLKCGGYRFYPYVDDVEIAFRIKKLGKIFYDFRSFVNISVRRLEKEGYLPLILKWLKGDFYLLIGKEVKSSEKYEKQTYKKIS